VLGHAINGALNGGPEKEEKLVELLRMLVMEWGADVEETFSIRFQMMPNLELCILHLAAIQEWQDVIELVVKELDVSIDTLLPATEGTPLHCACSSTLLTRPTALEFITWMVEELEADVLMKDKAGLTASQYASKRGGQYAREVRNYLRRKEEELTAPTAEEEEEEAFLLEGAPAEYKDVFSMGLMASSPVTASDGYVYERQSLERWIQTCEEEGNELTSPRTGAGMAALFLPNLTHRTLVRDWWISGRRSGGRGRRRRGWTWRRRRRIRRRREGSSRRRSNMRQIESVRVVVSRSRREGRGGRNGRRGDRDIWKEKEGGVPVVGRAECREKLLTI